MYLQSFGVAVTALVSLAGAAPPPPNYPSWAGSASTRCYTAMASTSVPWASSTTWSTHYTQCVSTSTVTSTVTTPPPSSTTTTTVTTTTTFTAPTTTFVSTAVSTTTSTVNVTTTTTLTATATTTTTVSTSTEIPTSSGFLPIQTTDPGTTYDGAAGGSPAAKRSYGSSGKRYLGRSSNQYPQGVKCHHFQPSSCSVSTITSTKTVQGTSTGTVTATSTSTVTSTVVPSATTTTTSTVTSTTTSSITSTATTTSTLTSTSTITTTTLYAACATNNFADYFNGNGIYGGDIAVGSYTGIDDTTASSAYDCCVAALTDPNGSSQVWFFSNGGTDCQIAIGNQCASQTDNQWEIDSQSGTAVGTIGNAYCGEFNS